MKALKIPLIIILCLTVLATQVMAAYPPSIYIYDLPATSQYTIKTDGVNYWYVRYDGFTYSSTDASSIFNAVLTAMTSGGLITVRTGNYHIDNDIIIRYKRMIIIQGEAPSKGVYDSAYLVTGGTVLDFDDDACLRDGLYDGYDSFYEWDLRDLTISFHGTYGHSPINASWSTVNMDNVLIRLRQHLPDYSFITSGSGDANKYSMIFGGKWNQTAGAFLGGTEGDPNYWTNVRIYDGRTGGNYTYIAYVRCERFVWDAGCWIKQFSSDLTGKMEGFRFATDGGGASLREISGFAANDYTYHYVFLTASHYYLTCDNVQMWQNAQVSGAHFYSTHTFTVSLHDCWGNEGSEFGDAVFYGLPSTAGAGTVSFTGWGRGWEYSSYQASCVNGTWLPYSLVSRPRFASFTVNGTRLINATSYYVDPTIIAQNSTHVQIQFLFNNEASGTIQAVYAEISKTVFYELRYET